MRWVFGICAIGFGLQHLTNINQNLEYVPKWLPPGAEFWVIVTGICFVLAGLAILSGILDVLAAWRRWDRRGFWRTRWPTASGLAQPYSDTARDAPPVAVSRVGCCEAPCHVHRPQ
ncbi:MAG: DoxX family membrane protein [Candidatus Sulfotelmatobacter sp.]